MYIVTAKEMYDIDHYTMQQVGVEGKVLMENAGRAIADKTENLLSKQGAIAVLAGPGNNGGDGFVIARTLLNKQYDVVVMQVVPDDKIKGDARYHKQLYLNCGGRVITVSDKECFRERIEDKSFIIDAMFGIGISGKLRAPMDDFVTFLNQGDQTVISVDIPSGLPADDRSGTFTAVQADWTFMVGAAKRSAFLPETSLFYGNWEMVDIGFPPFVVQKFARSVLWTEEDFRRTIPRRGLFSHKGNHGRGLIIGANDHMPGSILMSTKAALKAGAGLITAGTTEKVIQMIAAQSAESMYMKLPDQNGFLIDEEPLEFKPFDAVAIGIGMGRQKETEELVKRVIKHAEGPVVIDADGLYHMKQCLEDVKKRTNPLVITPHPGEMAMLLDLSVKELLSSPFHHAKVFAQTYGIYVILKGKYTIVTAPGGKQSVNATGNQGLSKGGTGDVLTGIVLAQIMQEQTIFHALCNACWIHGKSADLQVEKNHSYYDLLATDVIDGIPFVYRMCL